MSSARIEEVDREADDPLNQNSDKSSKSNSTKKLLGDASTNALGAAEGPRTISRFVTAELRGSLAKLATGGTSVKWSLADTANAVFGPTAGDKGFAADSEGCDIKNAVLHELTIVEMRSSFPCALGVNITGVQGSHFSKEGTPYAKILLEDTRWSGIDSLVTPDEMTNSEYLKKYPGMNRDNLNKVGIVNVPGEDYVFVDSAHPIVEMLQVNAAVLQVDMTEAKLIDGRWYKVASQVVSDCTKLLDQQLLQHLPIVDLSQFNITAERLGKIPWDSTHSVIDSISQANKNYDPQLERIMTKNNCVQIQMKLTYGFM